MHRAPATTSASPHPFLELHFYKGGLRTEFSSETAERPTWAPAPETVGFRDEITLDEGDLVVELAKFGNDASVVTWVGVYHNSPDQIYGDRRNHVGLGVWLFNQVPSEPALLVDGLIGLLKITGGSPEDVKVKGLPFLQKYMSGWLTSYCQLPEPLGGLARATSPALDWIGFAIDRTDQNNENAINEAFFQLLYLPPARPGISRALLLLADKASAKAALSGGFEKLKAKRLGVDFLGKLPGAFAAQSAHTEMYAKQLDAQVRQNDDLHAEIDRLQADLSAEVQSRVAIERDLTDLRGSLEGNDEIRRHQAIIERLNNTHQDLFEVKREVRDSHNHLARLIQDELRYSKQGHSGRTNSAASGELVRSSQRSVQSQQNSWIADNLVFFALIAAIFVAAAILIWLIYRYVALLN